MKKIVLALGAVAIATTIQAATVTWGITAITDSADNAAAAGMVGYFLDASTYSAFSALSADQVASYVTSHYTYTGTTTANARTGAVSLGVTSGNYSANDEISGYIVLFDTSSATTASNYVATEVLTTQISAAGANASLGLGTLASYGGWESAAVPEPTSGILMLLGLAGLALKRKQA